MLSRLYREFFRALSNRTRFAIVQLLRERPHYVGEMADKLGFDQSRISHNLGCLLNCGFVQWEWQGKNKVYGLHPDLPPILGAIDRHILRYGPALNGCAILDGEARACVEDKRSRQASRTPRSRKSLRTIGVRS